MVVLVKAILHQSPATLVPNILLTLPLRVTFSPLIRVTVEKNNSSDQTCTISNLRLIQMIAAAEDLTMQTLPKGEAENVPKKGRSTVEEEKIAKRLCQWTPASFKGLVIMISETFLIAFPKSHLRRKQNHHLLPLSKDRGDLFTQKMHRWTSSHGRDPDRRRYKNPVNRRTIIRKVALSAFRVAMKSVRSIVASLNRAKAKPALTSNIIVIAVDSFGSHRTLRKPVTTATSNNRRLQAR